MRCAEILSTRHIRTLCDCDGDWRFVWSERYSTMNNVNWFVLNEFGLLFPWWCCLRKCNDVDDANYDDTLILVLLHIAPACEQQTNGRTPIIIICMQNKLSLYAYVLCYSAKFPNVNTVHIDVGKQWSCRFSLCTDSTIWLLINRSNIFHRRALCFYSVISIYSPTLHPSAKSTSKRYSFHYVNVLTIFCSSSLLLLAVAVDFEVNENDTQPDDKSANTCCCRCCCCGSHTNCERQTTVWWMVWLLKLFPSKTVWRGKKCFLCVHLSWHAIPHTICRKIMAEFALLALTLPRLAIV